jgi:hypothetical protein
MDRHDWELLDRQMSHLQPTPPAPRGLNTLVLVGSFLAGMTTGAFLFASAGQPVQTASENGKAAVAFIYGSENAWR